jgi:DNA/RNA-binding domain of Phe-tRNA-synthetase-like protein
MFMADDQGVISDVIYGPDERTKLTPGVDRVLFAAYGPPGVAAGDIESHLKDIEHYCRLAAPGSKTDFLEVHRA